MADVCIRRGWRGSANARTHTRPRTL